jgi:hypothetical protein
MRRCAPTELQPICPSGYQINDCGRPYPPPGEYIDLECNLFYSNVLAADTLLPNEQKRLPEDTDLILMGICLKLDPAFPSTDYYYRIQFPDGRYSSNARESVSLTCATGTRKRIFFPGETYQAGSFIPFELENRTAQSVTVAITFECMKRIYLKDLPQ